MAEFSSPPIRLGYTRGEIATGEHKFHIAERLQIWGIQQHVSKEQLAPIRVLLFFLDPAADLVMYETPSRLIQPLALSLQISALTSPTSLLSPRSPLPHTLFDTFSAQSAPSSSKVR
jgi:hypothetical protein